MKESRSSGKARGAPTAQESTPLPHYLGHRARQREKFRQTHGEGWADYDVLELFLFFFVPYKDTKPLAKALLARFGSFEAMAMAEESALCEVPGVGATTALALNVYGEMVRRQARQKIASTPLLDSWKNVLEYCRVKNAYQSVENVHILFMNTKNYLIADEVLFSGTLDQAPFYIRDILKRALELQASAMILVHNHPSGDPTPSAADIDTTRKLASAAELLRIRLYDHLIITKTGYTSLRDYGVI